MRKLTLMWIVGGCLLGVTACSSDGGASDAGPKAEDTAALCQDGLDNDDDGMTDCDDGECVGFAVCGADGGGGHLDGSVDDAPVASDGGELLHPGCSAGCRRDQACVFSGGGGTCQDVGVARACPSGKYAASLPANDGIFYVDGTFSGTGDGTQTKPFKTIGAALGAIPAGKKYTVAIAEGVYDEALTIGVRDNTVVFGADLVCSCPDRVRIAQPISIEKGTTTQDLKVTIDGCSVSPVGFDPDSATDWSCNGAGQAGIDARGGVATAGTFHLLVRESVVAGWCRGIYFAADPGILSENSICVAHSRLAANYEGLRSQNAALQLQFASPFPECKGLAQTISLTRNRIDHNRDYGVVTLKDARGVALDGNIVENNGTLGGKTSSKYGLGIGLYEVDGALLTGNVVRANHDRGIGLRNVSDPVTRRVVVQRNLVQDNRIAGIAVQGLQTELEIQVDKNVVAGTKTVTGAAGGDGIQASIENGVNYYVAVANNTLDKQGRTGVFFDGVGGKVQFNRITNNANVGVHLQQTGGSASSINNTYAGNALGDERVTETVVLKHGIMPLPPP